MCRIKSRSAAYSFIWAALTLRLSSTHPHKPDDCASLASPNCRVSNSCGSDQQIVRLRSSFETRKTGNAQKLHQTTQSFLTSVLLSVPSDYVRCWGAISGPENSVLYPAVTATSLSRSKELRRCFFFFIFFF